MAMTSHYFLNLSLLIPCCYQAAASDPAASSSICMGHDAVGNSGQLAVRPPVSSWVHQQGQLLQLAYSGSMTVRQEFRIQPASASCDAHSICSL
jgi:hypothetical protein